MKLSQTAEEVIALAAAIRNYWDTELPKRHANYPLVAPDEDSGPPPPESDTLRDLLASLPEDDIYKIVLLMYVGRGDFGTDDLSQRFEALKKRFPRRELAITQILGKVPLADYLADGVEELKRSGLDVDQLLSAKYS